MRICLAAILVAISTSSTPISQAQTPTGPTSLEYDRTAPVDLQEVGVTKRGDVEVHDISYASPKGGRVTAYLVVPPGKGPFAAVEFVHWGQGNRTEFLSEALLYARAGIISLLLDAPPARADFRKAPSFID